MLVADGAEEEALKDVELPLVVEADGLAVPTKTVCVAEEVKFFSDSVEAEFDMNVEFDVKADEELENVVVEL